MSSTTQVTADPMVPTSGPTTVQTIAQVEALVLELMASVRDELVAMVRPAHFVPSPPDTSKFVAAVSGMVEQATNVHWYAFGLQTSYANFLKIGSAIPYQKRDAAYARLRAELAARTRQPADGSELRFDCTDGTVRVAFLSATSWGGIGLRIIRPSA